MLVIARGVGESVIIGEGPDQIVITVVRSNRDQLRLGIEAPAHIKILRDDAIVRGPKPSMQNIQRPEED
jgi:carbon storage regulator